MSSLTFEDHVIDYTFDNAASITLTMDAAVVSVGDFIWIQLMSRDNGMTAAISGFTARSNLSNPSPGVDGTILTFYKIADASDAAGTTYSVTTSDSSAKQCDATLFWGTNVDTSDPFVNDAETLVAYGATDNDIELPDAAVLAVDATIVVSGMLRSYVTETMDFGSDFSSVYDSTNPAPNTNSYTHQYANAALGLYDMPNAVTADNGDHLIIIEIIRYTGNGDVEVTCNSGNGFADGDSAVGFTITNDFGVNQARWVDGLGNASAWQAVTVTTGTSTVLPPSLYTQSTDYTTVPFGEVYLELGDGSNSITPVTTNTYSVRSGWSINVLNTSPGGADLTELTSVPNSPGYVGYDGVNPAPADGTQVYYEEATGTDVFEIYDDGEIVTSTSKNFFFFEPLSSEATYYAYTLDVTPVLDSPADQTTSDGTFSIIWEVTAGDYDGYSISPTGPTVTDTGIGYLIVEGTTAVTTEYTLTVTNSANVSQDQDSVVITVSATDAIISSLGKPLIGSIIQDL